MNSVLKVRKLVVVFAAVVLCAFAGCSGLIPKTPNDELRAVLVRVAGDYLRHVVNADEGKIGGTILWTDFLEDAGISKEEYIKQLLVLKRKKWNAAEHPLLGLDVTGLRWYGELAVVEFRKAKQPDYPEIRVELLWAGNGWLVKEDNLFGSSALIADWQKDSAAFKRAAG